MDEESREPIEHQLTQYFQEKGRKGTAKQKNHSIYEYEGQKIFVKHGTGGAAASLSTLQCEWEGLSRLKQASNDDVIVPEPYLVGVDPYGSSFIAMEYISMCGGGSDGQLGRGVANIHAHKSDFQGFGFVMDGVLGAEKQINTPSSSNWVEFWREHRLGYQLKRIQSQYRDEKLIEKGKRLMSGLDLLFSDLIVEDIQPSLLHGDLWCGNMSFSHNSAVIFDPAPYYGHHEADIGIMKMFGGFGPNFFGEYRKIWPKKEGSEKREMLYELHHHLNHYNIFGRGYRGGAMGLMDALLSQMKPCGG